MKANQLSIPLETEKPDLSNIKPGTAVVPFNRPAFIGSELQEIQKAIFDNKHISGVGPYTKFCESFLSDYYNTPVLLVTSCTHALEMSAFLLNLGEGDEVIVPSFTFVSTANAFVVRGCQIRFAECDTYGQLCIESVKRQITDKTKAVCVVHYAGNSTDMEALVDLCKDHGIALIEDAAQAIGGNCNNQRLGTWGDLATLSFHETKNVTSGEGGALIINNPKLLERAYYLREKGTNRTQFFEGMVDKYTWVDQGSSYVLSDMNAAYLSVQLQNLDKIHNRREITYRNYDKAIKPLLGKLQASFLESPLHNTLNYHLFALVFEEKQRRSDFIQFMKKLGIVTPFHYVALHQSPMGLQYLSNENFENTNVLTDGLVRLPLFYNITSWQEELVISSVEAFAQQLK